MVTVAGVITQAKLDYDKGLSQELSVNEGNPDKLVNQVLGAMLDGSIVDPLSKVICGVLTRDNMVMVAGEITQAKLDYDKGHSMELSVNEGHPDKLGDQVLGALLDGSTVGPLSYLRGGSEGQHGHGRWRDHTGEA